MEEWIPVYATVIGPKLRRCGNILGCSDGEVLGILNFLWMWGRYNTEESGLILYADKTDIANCILMQNRGSVLDPNDVVDALIECGWIDEVGNELYIHDWDVWQSAWIKLKKTRERDAMRKRDARKREKEAAARRQSADESQDTPVESPTGNPPDAPADSPPGEQLEMGQLPKLPEKAAEPKPPAYSEEFEKWWKAYPRRLDKGNAYKKYKARRNDGFSDAELLEAAQNYAAQCRKLRTEQQYIKHPKTFLSESLPFTDYIKKQEQTEAESEDFEPSYKNPFSEYKGDHDE